MDVGSSMLVTGWCGNYGRTTAAQPPGTCNSITEGGSWWPGRWRSAAACWSSAAWRPGSSGSMTCTGWAPPPRTLAAWSGAPWSRRARGSPPVRPHLRGGFGLLTRGCLVKFALRRGVGSGMRKGERACVYSTQKACMPALSLGTMPQAAPAPHSLKYATSLLGSTQGGLKTHPGADPEHAHRPSHAVAALPGLPARGARQTLTRSSSV